MNAPHQPNNAPQKSPTPPDHPPTRDENSGEICPVCGASLLQEKCKVVCRSPRCLYRIIYNCAEF